MCVTQTCVQLKYGKKRQSSLDGFNKTDATYLRNALSLDVEVGTYLSLTLMRNRCEMHYRIPVYSSMEGSRTDMQSLFASTL